MILTVTLNAALDITYDVDELVPHGSHRVTAVRQRAGGKGVNVASVLTRMGHPVIATGIVGRRGPATRSARISRRGGCAARFVDGGGSSRRTVNVVSAAHGDATIFNEPGPELTATRLGVLGRRPRLRAGRGRGDVVVLSGSLPPGLPDDAYAELVDLGHAHEARVIVDADGAALRGALTAGPDLVTPNRAELLVATGTRTSPPASRPCATSARVTCWSPAVPTGLVLMPEQGCRLARPAAGAVVGQPDRCR